MNLIGTTKQGIFRVAKGIGVMSLVTRSGWRRRRLLIVCYHGVSLDDEHEWNPWLYMRQDLFRRRMQALARNSQVLPLDEGVRRLYDGTLPNAAVAITVDDGAFDFLARAWPVLDELSLPVTVYQTTFYSEFNRPVFDTFASYLLWKGRRPRVSLEGLIPGAGASDLSDAAGRARIHAMLLQHARAQEWNADEKDARLDALAERLDVDIGDLRRRRVLHLLNTDEIAMLASRGVDFQMHSHRHRTPDEAQEFSREIDENRIRLERLTQRPAKHYCYPSGVYRRRYLTWLRDADVHSATTCDPGMATVSSEPLLLPRLVDTEHLTDLTFEAWSSGLADLLPRRTRLGAGADIGQ